MELPWWVEPSLKISALVGIGAGVVFAALQIFVTQGDFGGYKERIAALETEHEEMLVFLDDLAEQLRVACSINAGYSSEIALMSSQLHDRIAEVLENANFDDSDTRFLKKILGKLEAYREQIEGFEPSCTLSVSGSAGGYTVRVSQ